MHDLDSYCIAVLKSENIQFQKECFGDTDDKDGMNTIITFSLPQGNISVPVRLSILSHSPEIAKYSHKVLISCQYDAKIPENKLCSILDFIGRVNDFTTQKNEGICLHYNFSEMTLSTQAINIFGYKLNFIDVKIILNTLLKFSLDLYEKCGSILTKIINGELNSESAFYEFKNKNPLK